MTSNNTDDMPNDNDVQPTIQTRHLLEATSQHVGTLNRNALFQHWLDQVKSNEARALNCRCRVYLDFW